MDDIVARVIAERRMRGWSQKAAAEAGGTTNQTWSRFEGLGGRVTPTMRIAIARAYDWPENWMENPPALPVNRLGVLLERLDAQEAALRSVVALLDRLGIDVSTVPAEFRPETRKGPDP